MGEFHRDVHVSNLQPKQVRKYIKKYYNSYNSPTL